jgi:hypothetical protein
MVCNNVSRFEVAERSAGFAFFVIFWLMGTVAMGVLSWKTFALDTLGAAVDESDDEDDDVSP